jgi:hypothetical protein
MTGILEAFAFSSVGEGLTGARARPNRSVGGPVGKLECQVPSGDPGEEVTAGEAVEVDGLHVSDVPLIHESRYDEPGRNEVSEPLSGEGIILVVVRIHSESSISAFCCCNSAFR